ncbi:MAG: Uncharacterized protein G01um101448_1014 [Parcubacteria group bacterium Gr01-1014_48]|nr:MAG: Uncharacterized protein Greene041614_855 [Parcubacteria group bacterium Greene0416_14]TSC72249.1 MAG: Uncharacterized protein G01um101448_1014 [Parcubacteria group bacterium Gr01-1014_48]TSD00637.1 MAG: Uncharacterized protein Greene101415_740 [Parcubacteria group bacterium Greene1014_15]TSD08073.1 MAG: Uncharacterized protein Greene07144_423 [Parcubacteria group bacterium Greene0714_4]
MGNEKDNNKANMLSDNALHKPRMNVFKNDAFTNFVHKKTERITTALYMITNLLPVEEPLKWKLREKGIELMSYVLHFGTGSLMPNVREKADIMPLIIGQVSLLEVAYVSGAISEMNFLILKREYEQIIELFEKAKTRRRTSGHEGQVIPKSFFDLPHESSLVELLEQADEARDSKKTSDISKTPETHLQGQETARIGTGAYAPLLPRVSYGTGGPRNSRSKTRRESIIAVLREQGTLSIKDVTKVVRGCSEKTIQRELLSLVRDGIVMKEGERRWSTYTIVS